MSHNQNSEIISTNTRNQKKDTKKSEFSSTCSMFVTLVGYSQGLSDIWRFPFMVYRNGGGAFLIPFVITIVLCGIPMYFLEHSVANFCGKGPYGIWELSPIFRGVGMSVALAYYFWLVGSSVFRSWLAMFLLDSFTSPLPWTHCQNPWNTRTCKENPFVQSVATRNMSLQFNTSTALGSLLSNTTNFTSTRNGSLGMTSAEEYWQFEAVRLSSGITDMAPILWKHILCMLVLRLVVFLSLVKSIKSIEKVMYVITIIPMVFPLVVMIQSLTLPGVEDGLYEFFYPDFNKLKNPEIWIEAFLMAFYTLAFGWGGILTMGSHANLRDNCVRTSILVPVIDCLNAISNGVVCFMVLGNMAHAYGVKVYDVIEAGFSAGVVTYVSALSVLPLPHVWNFTFILTAILIGLDAQIVPLEMCLQVLGEMFPKLYPKYRMHTLITMSILLFVLALPTCTGAGGYIFLWLDWYVGVWIGPICAFMELFAVGWIYGMDRFSMDVSLMIGKPAPWFFRFFIVFFAPLVVIVIFITACVEYVPPKYGSYIYPPWARGVGWLIVFCILSPILIKGAFVLYQQTGSMKMRFKKSIKSTNLWRPKDSDARKIFDSQQSSYNERSIRDMMYFIIFGKYKNRVERVSEKELEVLVD